MRNFVLKKKNLVVFYINEMEFLSFELNWGQNYSYGV